MADKNLIGRCGLYCGICEIYRAYRDSKELRAILAKKHGCSPDEVRCEGCQALDVYAWSYDKEWGANCKILKCLNARRLQFCYECNDYGTCNKHAEFTKICSVIGLDLTANLRMLKEGRIEEWLSEQDKKWRCLKCNKPIIVSYGFKQCHWCGHTLRD